MAEGQFEKDFGYLMPFLDKVAASTGSIADRAAREELTRLIAEEKQRWTRIRQLLSGAPGSSSNQTGRAGAKPLPDSENTGSDKPTAVSREPLSFTVGSLRPRSK